MIYHACQDVSIPFLLLVFEVTFRSELKNRAAQQVGNIHAKCHFMQKYIPLQPKFFTSIKACPRDLSSVYFHYLKLLTITHCISSILDVNSLWLLMETMAKKVRPYSRNKLNYRAGNSTLNDPTDAAEREHNHREYPKG